MIINTDSLRVFIAAADHGSFTKAGDALFLTQPAISKRIAQLEEQLGTKLFDRIGRQIVLTEAGKTLLPKAKNIANNLNDMARAIGNLSETVEGELALGTSHHIGLHRLPPYLKAYSQCHPQVKLSIRFTESEDIYEQVIQGTLELGIVTLPEIPHPHLHVTPLWQDSLAFMVAIDHPLSTRNALSLDAVLDYPAILPESKTFTRKIVEKTVAQSDKPLLCEYATNNLETIRMLTKVGLGWSVLPVSMEEKTIKKLDLENIELKRELGVIRHQQRTLSNAAEKIIDALKNKPREILTN